MSQWPPQTKRAALTVYVGFACAALKKTQACSNSTVPAAAQPHSLYRPHWLNVYEECLALVTKPIEL